MENYKKAIESIRNHPPHRPRIEEDSIYTTIYNQRDYTIPQPTAFLNAQALRNLYKDVYQVGQEAIKNA